MWNRSQLKTAAKGDLKGFYWLSFAVCLVAGILTGGGLGLNLGSDSLDFGTVGEVGDIASSAISPALMTVFGGALLFASVFGWAFWAFVTNPVLVGKCRFFLHINEGEREIGTLFSAFKNGYTSVVKTMFMMNLFVFLWSLLFIIPGIIKSYSYRMVPYILSENPALEYKDALRASAEMTSGQKFKMFVLDLSFIGWCLLGVMAFGVGVLFVLPYIEATWAQLYLTMRQRA